MSIRVLFANISYQHNGIQQGDFKYVVETGDAMEKNNFESLEFEGKEMCLGYFEPGYAKGGYFGGGKQCQVKLENIDKQHFKADSIDNVLVVWCATIKDIGSTAIVGWYKNATLYRRPNIIAYNVFSDRGNPKDGYLYNVKADKNSCVSLPYNEVMKEYWFAPRQRTSSFGFGQKNMWYAKEAVASEYVLNVINKIDNYSGLNLII
jgi:hypothetical protein